MPTTRQPTRVDVALADMLNTSRRRRAPTARSTSSADPAAAAHVNSVYAYDTSTNIWSAVSNTIIAVFADAAATGADGRIYGLGGFGSASQTYVSPVSPMNWTPAGTLPSLGLFTAATTGGDGRIYDLGGGDGILATFNGAAAYHDPRNDQLRDHQRHHRQGNPGHHLGEPGRYRLRHRARQHAARRDHHDSRYVRVYAGRRHGSQRGSEPDRSRSPSRPRTPPTTTA